VLGASDMRRRKLAGHIDCQCDEHDALSVRGAPRHPLTCKTNGDSSLSRHADVSEHAQVQGVLADCCNALGGLPAPGACMRASCDFTSPWRKYHQHWLLCPWGERAGLGRLQPALWCLKAAGLTVVQLTCAEKTSRNLRTGSHPYMNCVGSQGNARAYYTPS
jgi:hypothetical protein